VHNQLIKAIITILAVIFKNWHFIPPNLLGISLNIILESCFFKSRGFWGIGHRAESRWLKAQGARPKVEEFRS
jgi:hypothetical protein